MSSVEAFERFVTRGFVLRRGVDQDSDLLDGPAVFEVGEVVDGRTFDLLIEEVGAVVATPQRPQFWICVVERDEKSRDVGVDQECLVLVDRLESLGRLFEDASEVRPEICTTGSMEQRRPRRRWSQTFSADGIGVSELLEDRRDSVQIILVRGEARSQLLSESLLHVPKRSLA